MRYSHLASRNFIRGAVPHLGSWSNNIPISWFAPQKIPKLHHSNVPPHRQVVFSVSLIDHILFSSFFFVVSTLSSCLHPLSVPHLLKTMICSSHFLVACYMTRHPALSVRPPIHPSVRLSVGHTFTFFYDFNSLPSLLLPKWSSELKYAHPHATGVAVYPCFVWALAEMSRLSYLTYVCTLVQLNPAITDVKGSIDYRLLADSNYCQYKK